MSKSFNVSFQQSFKVTLSDAQIQAIRGHLSEVVTVVAAHPDRYTDAQKDRQAVIKDLLQKSDEEFLASFLKTAYRDGLRKVIMEEMAGDREVAIASKFAPATVTVTPRG